MLRCCCGSCCSGVLAVQLLCCRTYAAQERFVSEDARYGAGGGGGGFGGLGGGGFGGLDGNMGNSFPFRPARDVTPIILHPLQYCGGNAACSRGGRSVHRPVRTSVTLTRTALGAALRPLRSASP